MENKNIDNLIENYKLSEEEHNAILEILKKQLFQDKIKEEKPTIIFVVGQPGCGKTTFIKSTDFSNCVIINSDNYRTFNKYSKEILEKYPTHYAKLTNFDAHLWGDKLFFYAIQNNYSVLREKAPTDYSILEILKTKPHNYSVIINVVIAGNLQSLLATRERYEKEILESKNAKLSNIEIHNNCYNILPQFIIECLSLGIKINYVVPVNDQFKSISVKDDCLELLQNLRKESNIEACLEYNARIAAIKKSMLNRNASSEQFTELNKIEKIYQEINCCTNKKLRKK